MLANIELPSEAAAACAQGAAGVGLYRTEFLFLERGAAPDEDAQLEVYREVLRGAAPSPVVFRTFDLGGDKVPSGGAHRAAVGQNPALGLRALRLALRRPDLFRAQVRAILRAGAEGDARLLLPLVTNVEELRLARSIVESCARELEAEGRAHARVPLGAMVEVPAAALLVDRLAAEVDFLSVGTNDLVQYTLAVDRCDPDVASLADPLDPAVLALLRIVAAGAGEREITMCGDMAADPLALPVVLGIGFRRLSVPLASLPFVAEGVRRLDGASLAALAADAARASSAAEVRALVRERLSGVLGSLWTEQGIDGR
ncbi:MAG: phosphoenolpyruvate--protein phosphotransferase [Myxococcales bacterium]|nr:phosphoenolpyruvate--protein phosphotransferase [Myxococcales bacterium]